MSKVGWLVNDCLTCIPGTKTFWYDLLEWFPNLIDKTGGHTKYNILANRIEQYAKLGAPDYIIRNASYFRKMNISCKQIALLQDPSKNDMVMRNQQVNVCNNVNVTVFNSSFVYNQYKNDITKCDVRIIPLGIDFDLFNTSNNKHKDVLPNSILFVGAKYAIGKRLNIILDLINTTNYNFCLVMKDDFTMNHPRVRVFNRVSHNTLVKIYNSCEMLVSASLSETQGLASLEAGACDVPLILSNSGALYNIPSGVWGLQAENDNYLECIKYIKSHKEEFSPREFLLNMGFDKDSCKKKWINIIEEI